MYCLYTVKLNNNYSIHITGIDKIIRIAQPFLGGYFNPRLDLVIDEEHNGVDLHLGKIADFMENWKCRIAEELGLTSADIANIEYAHSKDLNLQKYV